MARRRTTPRAKPSEATASSDCSHRRCIVSGERLARDRLIRFVLGPDGDVVPDLAARLPGRGLWVRSDRRSLDEAVRRKRFHHAARGQVVVVPDLADRVGDLLARRALEYLGLARRAGELVSGFEKTRQLIEAGHCAVLVQARDAAPGGREKLAHGAGDAPVVTLFDVAELSLALGRQNVVHAALRRGGLADRFRAEAARLAGFREHDAGSGAAGQIDASSKEGGT